MTPRQSTRQESDNPWAAGGSGGAAGGAAGGSGSGSGGGPSGNPPPYTPPAAAPEKAKPAKEKPKSKAEKAAEADMTSFFDQVAGIRDAIAAVKASVMTIEETHQKALTVISEEQSQRAFSRLLTIGPMRCL